MRHLPARVLGVTALLLAGACTDSAPRDIAGPEYAAATALLDRAQAQTQDPTFEDPRFAEVLAAFRRVPADSPDRPLADYWIQRLEVAQGQAEARRRTLGAELLAPATAYREYRESTASVVALPPEAAAVATAAPPPTTAAGREARPAAVEEQDKHGRGRAYWERRARRLRDRRARLDAEAAVTERSVDRACRAIVTPDECARSEIRLAEIQDRRARVDEDLVALKDEARRAGALPGWIR